MVRYKIHFSVGNVPYYTEATSSFPTDNALIAGSFDEQLARRNAIEIAATYQEMNHISGHLDLGSVDFEIVLDNSSL